MHLQENKLFQPLTLTFGTHKMLLSTLYIMWAYSPGMFEVATLKEEMHLQKIHYLSFDFVLEVEVAQTVAQYPLHHGALIPCKV